GDALYLVRHSRPPPLSLRFSPGNLRIAIPPFPSPLPHPQAVACVVLKDSCIRPLLACNLDRR
ncbi:MAG: hypothetical protein NC078_10045, partial [Ruminococcus sp.]|nr:hypothetical protein [Ruminococcus sp.]